jgi:hypothetical protein
MKMNQTMFSFKRSTITGLMLSAAAWAMAAASPASAATVVYTDSASFLSQLGSSYFEDYNSGISLGSHAQPGLNFTGGIFSYNVDVPVDTTGGNPATLTVIDSPQSQLINRALATSKNDIDLVFSFNPGITAVGGDFFLTDSNGNVKNGSVTLTLSDGTTQALINPGAAGFTGFVSDSVDITSLIISTGTGGAAATADNVYVGSIAPEPGSMGLILSGLAAGIFLVRKRRTA